MSSGATSDHTNALLAKADEAIKANELQRASEALREASHLDSGNEQVKQRWAALQKLDAGGNALGLLRNYLGSQDAEAGSKALEAVKAKQLPKGDAVQAAELLLRVNISQKCLDAITGTLLSRNVEARKLVATRLSVEPTEIFQLLFERGEQSFSALAMLPVENVLWSTTDRQAAAQQDVFRLCVATLIEAGAEHIERAMRAIARLFNFAPDLLAPLVDADVTDAILSSLDIRLPQALRSQAMLATSKLLEATKDRGEELFSGFITGRAAKQTNEDLIIAFSAAAAAFPVIPTVAGRLFLIDGFVQQLVPNLERNWDDGAAGQR